MLTLTDVLEALTGKHIDMQKPLTFSEAAIDSRQVIPGSLFVALPGVRTDGHQFVGAAFQNGAILALVEKDLPQDFPTLDLRAVSPETPLAFPASWIPGQPLCLRVNNTLEALQQLARYWRRRLNIRVIGITGSVGKSTTKELIAEVLSQRYRTLKNPGNLNNEIGLPLTLLRLGKGHERAVLEMGFYVPGEIALLCDIAQPQVGVITNIGTVHAERAGSQEAIARGKSELVQALPVGGYAILNHDDPWVRWMADKTQAQILYYGLTPEAHLWADEIETMGLEGIRFRLHYRRESFSVRVPLIGHHSVQTALRATAVGIVEGLTWGEIIHGLQRSPTQLRLVAVRSSSGALILDDTYNASPESTLASLQILHEMKGRRIAVLGDMLELGPYEQSGHEKVGVRAAEVADVLVAVGELSKIIARAAREAGMKPEKIFWVPDTSQAIEVLRPLLKEGDVVLIKGSHGLRMDRIVSALEVVG
ncbi:UDP-N-acetylmuramoyl-tripeptide--D-alanyl-D-alanine ligase [Anaerolinea thermophila]|uniref:UDP-N-acetylmuramoyl-tripeptide--D-alanyl-D-alanine ligase n=1 Tax=Anaerolinea thermophila (strain DSM 14523 / JCM 11388 / NBRC 100420 / UNI-1) TaxID=926569 RepID=E8MYM4_ANATU|nr:UDP-N-acetylmuramoyl-tripeptide--D-alanyl-D-alanine ligase [Anaerolinea thermophila]BAJ64360.1 UDP-N-acetylmuramoyl-tripeptide--D-alanyl-D-alanine ligase [Anaerolinea thermophila UNI-1]